QSLLWDKLRRPVMTDLPDNTNIFQRLTTGLGKLNTMISNQDSQLLFGSIPSTSFPGLIGGSRSFRLPAPVMLTLLQCPQGPVSTGPHDMSLVPSAAQPSMLGDFPTAVHVQLVDSRMVTALGVTLYSGIETVIPASAGGGG